MDASFLNPKSIAVYGASTNGTSPATIILQNLLGQGFDGEVVAINPKYDRVAGQACFPSQTKAGTCADLAVIAIPPSAVSEAILDCGDVGTSTAIVITAGFQDGTDAGSTAHLVETAKDAGLSIIGPNCLGLIRPHLRLNATFQPTLPPAGGLALISQSGAICSAMADMAADQGLAFSLMLSLGNSISWGLPEALEAAGSDHQTKVILAYVEGVRRGDAFRAALRRACTKKPVIVLKAGRHAAGSQAAATHTGALVGSDKVFSAVLDEAGAVQVQTLGEMLETARLLEATRVTGARLAIVTNGGGAGVLTADRLSDRGLSCPDLPEDTALSLDEVLSPNWSRANPLDIVGDATPDHYEAAVQACLASDAFDAVLSILSPQSMTGPAAVAEVLVRARDTSDKPLLSCFLGGSNVASAKAHLRSNCIPKFDLPEYAIVAFDCAVRAELPTKMRNQEAASPSNRYTSKQLAALSPLPPGMLSDSTSRDLLAQFGVPCPIPNLAKTEADAVALAADLPGAAVLKVASPDVSHKSEVDGVRVNIEGPNAVKEAFRNIQAKLAMARPDATFSGVTVEEFISLPDSRELLVGVTRDPIFGLTITFGAGGTLVELIDDTSTALLPLTRDRALRLIERTKAAALLGDYRNMAAVDINRLVDVLIGVSDLSMQIPNLEEMDINPLFAAPEGIVAVDARIRIG
ncbi:MAG: acetate--CoA ligase family protein [Pseudomonadota bacterium]